jgi:hypothetical protein
MTENEEWWEHYCPKQDDVMGFQKGVECDWCGATEDECETD